MKKTPFLSYILAALLACSGIPHAAASTDSNVHLTDDAPSWDVKANNWYYTYTDENNGVKYACYDLFVDAKDGRIVNGGWSSNIYIHSGASLTADYLLQWTDNPEGSELWRILYSYNNDDYRLHIYMDDNSTLNYTNRVTNYTIRLGALHFQEGATVNINVGVPVIEARSFGKYTDRSFTINAYINTTAELVLWNQHTSVVTLKYDQNMNAKVLRGDAYCAPYIDSFGKIILPASDNRTQLNESTIKMSDGVRGEYIQGYLGGSTLISLGDGDFWGRYIEYSDITEISWLLNNIEVRQGRSLAMRRGYYGGTISMRGASSLVFDMKVVPAGVDDAHLGGGATVVMENGNNTLDLAGKEVKLDVVVNENTTGNMLKNGSLTGMLTLEAGSALNADSAMCSWAGPQKIVMKNGSRLEMVGDDRWINDISVLEVNGTATIKNAYLRIKPGTEYALGNGVENLVGEGETFLSLDNSTLNLNDHTSKLNIKVWAASESHNNVIKNGVIDTYVEMDANNKLALQNVMLGSNATFSMGNNTQLDLGGQAIPLERIIVSSGGTASVSNFGGRVNLAEGHIYTLEYDAGGTPDVLKNNDSRLRLEGGNVGFIAGDDATILISNQSKDINLIVTSEGMFTLGNSQGKIQKITGGVIIKYNGPGTDTGNLDVNMLYQLIGRLHVDAENGRVNAGIIGQKDDIASTGYVSAKQILVDGFIGKNLELRAVSNAALEAGANAITVKGNAIAEESLIFNAAENGYGNIAFNSNLSAGQITMEGNNIEGDGDNCAVAFAACTILAHGGIKIAAGFTGGDMKMAAAQDISLGQVGMNGPVGKADISSQNGAITMRAFTGGSLKAVAKEALTISDSVAASGNAELAGRSVSIAGPITASGGSLNIESTAGNIIMQSGGTLSAGDSVTLDSKGNIIGSDAHVLGGDLTATAAQSITLGSIGTAENAVGEAVLTSQVGSITASSFTGSTLKVSAKGDVSINGGVTSLSGNAELTGKSVSIGGALAANIASASIKSTTGDITLGGALIAKGTITLDSANNINGQAADVQGGRLRATAAQSITLGKIGIDSGSAVLTATNGGITAGNFTGGALEASAKGAVTFNGGVTASSGNAELTGSSVSTGGALAANNASASIKSTTGDIKLGGALSAKDSITVQSAGNIAIGGDVTGDNLTATAAQSISLQAINIDSNAAVLTATNGGITAGHFIGSTLTATAGDSITLGNIGTFEKQAGTTALTATNGSIMVGNFAGLSLEASAKEAVTINWFVEAFSGSAKLTGGSVSILGTLAAHKSSADITSTTGDISLGGEVRVNDSITLNSAGSITGEAADMHGGILTATAEQSIALKNIDIFFSPATLTAKSGSITAGKVTVVNLTANAAGNIALGDVEVGQTGAGIVSTGGNVVLNSFSGSGAQISALNGSIQVNSAVSGTGNTFLAGQSVAFAAAASESGLSNATVSAPQVSWANGTTLTNVTLTGGAGEDGAEADAEVGVGGSLVLKESQVKGDVTIEAKDAKLTVDHSTITGLEQGAKDIELNGGSIGSVYLEEGKKLGTFTSSGTSRINELVCDLVVGNGILNGGELTFTPALGEDFGLVPGHLTVNQSTRLGGNLYLQVNPELNFSLNKANTETPLLTIDGTLECNDIDYIVINLRGDASVEGGETYALISIEGGESPEGWPKSLTISGLGAKQNEIFWVGGTLFYQNGSELATAVWTPGENHLWNTTDKNWTQDGHVYRYKDGVDVVFNDAGKGGEVQLEGTLAPKDVLVEGTCDYTFQGTGMIAGEAALTKNGSGTLTIATANGYSGGTTINGGTIAMKNAQALGSGTVTMAGGTTLDLGGFALGNSLALQGSTTIRNGTLTGTLTLADGASLNWWGEDLNLSGGATLGKDAHLYLNGKSLNNAVLTASGATIHNGTVTGNFTLADSVSYSWDALGGNGLTLSGGVTLGNGTLLNLDGNTVTNPITLKGTATLGNGTLNGAFSVADGHTLTLCDNLEGTGDITLGERATLNLDNHTLGKGVVLRDFATLGNGTLTDTLTLAEGTAFSWSGDSLQLNGGVTLKEGAALILGSHTLAGNVTLEGSAFIGGGTINSGFSVAGGHTLTLCGNLEGMGFITLGDTATLNLTGFELKNSVTLEGSATIGNGILHSPLSLEGGKALKLIGDLSGTGTIIMGYDSRLDLNGQTLDLAVDASFGNGNVIAGDGTINGDVTVGVYMDITGTLNGSGRIILKNSASLYAGTINNDVLVTCDKTNTQANIFSGTLNGTLTLADNASLYLRGELAGTGAVTMGDNTELDLGGHSIDSSITLAGDAAIGNGTVNADVTVGAGYTLNLTSDLEGNGAIILDENSSLDTHGDEVYPYILNNAVKVAGDASIHGTFYGKIAVDAGRRLEFKDGTTAAGGIDLAQGSELNLGGNQTNTDLNLAGDATIGNGTINDGSLAVAEEKTLTLRGNVDGTRTISLDTDSTLRLTNGTSVANKITGDSSATIVQTGNESATLTGDLSGFIGNVKVESGGALNIMNADSMDNVTVDVTLGRRAILGVYKGANADEESEGTLTISDEHRLAAAFHAQLNANLVMKAGSVLDVSATGGESGGLHMGSTVTLDPGNVLLSEADMAAVNGLRYMQAYDLFSGVDGLSLGGDFLSELGLADKWVKAADVFANDLFKSAEKEYYLFYSGKNQGGAVGYEGTVYLMRLPEPATVTLSLLALATLAARRRRK